MKKLIFLLIFSTLLTRLAAQNPNLNNAADTSYQERSRFSIVVTYDSKVLSAGRDFGTSQYGIFPSVGYYHKSGFYGRVGGNLLSDSVLTYTLTTATLGFQFDLTDSWALDLSYDRLFYPDAEEGILNNSVGLYTDVIFGAFSTGLSFSTYLGEENGYRLNTFLSAYFNTDKAGFLDNIAFAPSTSVLFGTENVTLTRLTTRQFERNIGVAWQERLSQRFPNRPPRTTTENKQVFGLLCWNVDAPVYFKKDKVTLGLIPTLVIPFELPGEDYEDLKVSFYGSASLRVSF